ncbi:hypothetical protein ABFP09_04195 [Acinetobacter junii]
MTIKASNLDKLDQFCQLEASLPLPSYQILINVSSATESALKLRKEWKLGLNPIEDLTGLIEKSWSLYFLL